MSSDTLRFELNDQVAVLTLNRPQARNAMNRELRDALMQALQRVDGLTPIRWRRLLKPTARRAFPPCRWRSH